MSAPAPSLSAVPSRTKRRTFLIKRGLQIKFVLWTVVFVAIAVSLIGWDFYDTFGRDVARDFMDPGLYELFRRVGLVIAAKLALYMVAVAFVAALISNKWAGPVYRFERSARTVARGDLTHRVRLRFGDELLDLQDEFNHMVEALQSLAAKDAHLAQRVAKQLEELTQPGRLPQDTLDRLREIKTEVEHLSSGFKV